MALMVKFIITQCLLLGGVQALSVADSSIRACFNALHLSIHECSSQSSANVSTQLSNSTTAHYSRCKSLGNSIACLKHAWCVHCFPIDNSTTAEPIFLEQFREALVFKLGPALKMCRLDTVSRDVPHCDSTALARFLSNVTGRRGNDDDLSDEEYEQHKGERAIIAVLLIILALVLLTCVIYINWRLSTETSLIVRLSRTILGNAAATADGGKQHATGKAPPKSNDVSTSNRKTHQTASKAIKSAATGKLKPKTQAKVTVKSKSRSKRSKGLRLKTIGAGGGGLRGIKSLGRISSKGPTTPNAKQEASIRASSSRGLKVFTSRDSIDSRKGRKVKTCQGPSKSVELPSRRPPFSPFCPKSKD